jgi:hypothetical protein
MPHVQDGIGHWIHIQQLRTSLLAELAVLDNKGRRELSFVQTSQLCRVQCFDQARGVLTLSKELLLLSISLLINHLYCAKNLSMKCF